MVVCIVWCSCLLVSWFLVVRISIAYDRIWILSYNLCVGSCLCGVHQETAWIYVLACVCVCVGTVRICKSFTTMHGMSSMKTD